MTISACDGSYIPDWLAEYHDWMAWASATNPWPLQSRHPTPTQQRAEVVPPLSGATAQALIEQRRDTTNFYRKAEK